MLRVKKFSEILSGALKNAGGEEQLQQKLPHAKKAKQLLALGDDRYLSEMTRCVFRAGFVWKVIDNKWPGFEAAFDGFNPLVVAHYSDEKIDALTQDTRIVRNRTKIQSVRDNAVFILDVQQQHGSFGSLVANWPADDIVGLWVLLKKQGSRLGGNSGPMLLRLVGKDTFILTEDVCNALVNFGFLDSINPSSKRDQLAAQKVFNELHQQSGRPLCELSRILALTIS